MKTESFDLDLLIADRADTIYMCESQIDLDNPIYLITWCPSPSELPDCSIEKQHLFNVNTMADFLKYCKCGCFCLEEFQKGDPHYHGWYQLDPDKRLGRITMIKVMNRFGRVEIIKVLDNKHVVINSYSKRGNVLWYYKKQVAEMALIPESVINRHSIFRVNHIEYRNFFERFLPRKSVAYLADVEANRAYYRKYYTFGSK